jgi:uncharacterized protein (DUF427 family)
MMNSKPSIVIPKPDFVILGRGIAIPRPSTGIREPSFSIPGLCRRFYKTKRTFYVGKTGEFGAKKMKAIWNDTILAESDDTVIVEGNHYFPADSINKEYFAASETHTVCGWKGTASYYDVVVNGATNKDAAWYYPETKDAAKEIENRVAFWKGVKIVE